MHLTQEQIADLTGQTAIHVNRMWRELLDQGLIAKQGEMFTLLDERGLRNCAQHVSRVGTLDFSWLPQPREMHLA